MTERQIEVFKELLKDKDFCGKEALHWLLWRNTTKPKLEVGYCCKVTDTSHRIWNVPIKDFNAKIVRPYCYKTSEVWFYEMKIVVRKRKDEYETTIFKSENELYGAEQCDDNITVLE